MEPRKPKDAWEAYVCAICGVATSLICPCGTARYCSKECQKVDWKQRGHREACKELRAERDAEATRSGEAPTLTPSPERLVFYGPAERTRADEARARIKANHEAARAWREANPQQRPLSASRGKRCPICLEDWDVNTPPLMFECCCRCICQSCDPKIDKTPGAPCPICRAPWPKDRIKEGIARLRRHADNDVPQAVARLAAAYFYGYYLLVKSPKKSLKLSQRAAELGDVHSWHYIGHHFYHGMGIKSDRKKAAHFYQIGAIEGDPWAQNGLAFCYELGAGVPRNFDVAKVLYEVAASQGLQCAKANLERVSNAP